MILDDILSEKKLLDKLDLPQITDELFEDYFKTGNRLNYEGVYFTRRKYLTVYGIFLEEMSVSDFCFASLKDGFARLEYILYDICSEITWALPPHINREMENWENTIDLFAAETAFAMAEIIEKVKQYISDEIYTLVKNNIFERVIKPFMDAKAGYSWWDKATMNWCAVCNSCIGGAALYVFPEGNEKEVLINRIVSNLTFYLDGFPKDGVCLEGIDYYYYAMGHLMMFWQIYEEKYGRSIGWDKHKGIKDIALFPQRCILPGGYSVAFSDCSRREMLRIGVQGMLAEHFDEVLIPKDHSYADFHKDTCYRYGLLSRDILVEKRLLSSMLSKGIGNHIDTNSFYFFPEAQWFIQIQDGRHAIAVKGGHNDEPHNHNDIGNFLIVKNEELILADIGSGEYTKDYFNENRYSQFCCRSMGHNVPIINDTEQSAGKMFHAEHFSVNSEYVTFDKIGYSNTTCTYKKNNDKSFDNKSFERTVSMDLSLAYPKEKIHLSEFIRKIKLDNNGKLELNDKISFTKGGKIIENFISLLPCSIDGNDILIRGQNNEYRLRCINQFSTDKFAYGIPKINKCRYSNHEGKTEEVYQLHFVFDVKKENNIIVTLL